MDKRTRDCRQCGATFTSSSQGRPPTCCSEACKKAWAKSAADRKAAQQRAADPRSQVRPCLGCGADLSAEHLQRIRCKPCNVAAGHRRANEKRHAAGKNVPQKRKLVAVPDGSALCTRCEEVLPIQAFPIRRRRSNKDGSLQERPNSYCTDCRAYAQMIKGRKKSGIPLDAPKMAKGEHRIRPIGTTWTGKNGYVLEKTAGHHRGRDGWVPQHILVAERKYGIPITADFTVHHKNAIRSDNRPENLELRLGQHGTGGDVMHVLLANDELRDEAVDILRAYGYVVAVPRQLAGQVMKGGPSCRSTSRPPGRQASCYSA